MKRQLIQSLLLAILVGSLSHCKENPTCVDEPEATTPEHLIDLNQYTLTWTDNFDSLNTEHWTIGLVDSASQDLVPGAVGTSLLNHFYDSYITPEDVIADNGSLKLLAQKRPVTGTSPAGEFDYTAGWIMSMHKVHFHHGYIEMKAKFPEGDKLWPAFWLIPEDLSWCPEWDMFEYFGYHDSEGYDQMGMHLCYDPWPDQQWSDCFMPNFHSRYSSSEWHTYGFIWTEEYAAWFIDGTMVRHLCSEGIDGWPDKSMYIVLNNGTRTSSPDETTVWPATFEVDYLKLYSVQ